MMRAAALLAMAGLWAAGVAQGAEPASPPLPALERFNLVLGTQTISPSYQFTDQPKLVETAQAIRVLGATCIKFALSNEYASKNGVKKDDRIRTLTDLAREPSHKKVLDMPFGHYILWAYPFSTRFFHTPPGGKGMAAEDRDREYRELYDFVRYLLTTYDGTGKRFLLGHWEGDGHLFGDWKNKNDPPPEKIDWMVDWLNTRQKAVDDAKRDTPHRDVEVFHYAEVNHVQKGMQGRKCMILSVVPRTNVDFVSYSCYDSTKDDIGPTLKKALDFIESKLPPKPGLPGKRVFIGEYGFPLVNTKTPEKQDALSREVIRAGLEWGCPYILYWEFFNNEVEKGGRIEFGKAGGRQRGFWMIDDKGARQPVYFTHEKFYQRAREYVRAFQSKNGRTPTDAEFRTEALRLLAAN